MSAAPPSPRDASLTSAESSEPFVEFGVGWAKVHFRREVTDQDRAKIIAALRTPAASTELVEWCGEHPVEAADNIKILQLEVEDARKQVEKLTEALRQIDDMPMCMANDSESLRHTIRSIHHISRGALKDSSIDRAANESR